MRKVRLLFCDDEQVTRDNYRNAFITHWPRLFSEDIVFDTCHDIKETQVFHPDKMLDEVAPYDALLLDLVWEDHPDGDKHGILLCRRIRQRFPELPIIIFSQQATVEHFKELIPLSISAYLSKEETNPETWCVEVSDALHRAYVDRSGLPLYKSLRLLLTDESVWNGFVVNEAASEVWRRENSHDKWTGFWDAMGNLVARERVKIPFDLMKDYFEGSDLFTLGIFPSMRGHLEHVLYVYFTGYVISHKLPIFRSAVNTAAGNLLGARFRPNNEKYYWHLFQLAWLACATLHDTGYSLELLPEICQKLGHIKTVFPFASFGESLPDRLDVRLSWERIQGPKNAFANILSFLNYPNPSWIAENAEFTDGRGHTRINHGVASGALFLDKLNTQCKQLVDQHLEERVFFEWAATAMALHSLKHPGSDGKNPIQLMADPLSALLLICDELQVWDRERPDESAESSKFRRVELASLEIHSNRIEADISCVPYAGIEPTHKDHGAFVEAGVLKTNEMLAQYLRVEPLSVRINHAVRGLKMELPSIQLP